jgi:hypothetical protein
MHAGDLPCILVGLVVACTWRLPFLISDLYNASSSRKRQAAPWGQLWYLIRDLPAVLLSPLLLSWRGVLFIRIARTV